MSTILVTGGAGFIGSNFVRLLLAESDHRVLPIVIGFLFMMQPQIRRQPAPRVS